MEQSFLLRRVILRGVELEWGLLRATKWNRAHLSRWHRWRPPWPHRKAFALALDRFLEHRVWALNDFL